MNVETRAKNWGYAVATTAALAVFVWRAFRPKAFGFWGWTGIWIGAVTTAYGVGYAITKLLISERNSDDNEDVDKNQKDMDRYSSMG